MAREMTFNGIDAMQRGRTAEAQNLFSRAAEAAPDDQRIRLELARSYLKNGQIHQAIAQMREAVRLSGGEAVYHIELGQLYAQTGQWELAREQAALALDNNRRLASAWALKGHVEQSMGELDAARISLSRALAHDPDLVAARFQLAQVYQRLGQPQRTLSVLESLMRQSGPDEVPQEQLLLQGIALAQIGQLDRSAWVLALAAERSEPLPDTLLELARVHVQRGDFANARRVLVRGREMFAKRPEFGTRLAELAANGDPNVQASF
jgi:Flp pilus assembly protein TadD